MLLDKAYLRSNWLLLRRVIIRNKSLTWVHDTEKNRENVHYLTAIRWQLVILTQYIWYDDEWKRMIEPEF